MEMIRAMGRRLNFDDDEYYEEDGDTEWDETGRTMISHIYVAFDKFIRSIQFGYLENGAQVLSTKYGSSEGSFRIVKLKEDEYVTGLSGVLGKGGRGIRNLTFHTNRGHHGPIGRPSDKYLLGDEIEIEPEIRSRSEFGGFFGSSNDYRMTSIGIYVSPNNHREI
ncbi:PREDICTED: jacalin-related lectin 24-like [Camelina sativa]|uniref:Jacalin-related lectin 24-like n=1 Tax=Camelina sativa TaxID=90675 RepID=A0ABM1QKR5_CAMSA|nr:PREDICTED: jacalin-related lectin 24-like [Camelina sativa]